MADSDITGLTSLTTVAGEDVVPVVDDPSGTPTTKKATVENLIAGTLQDYNLHNLVRNNPGQIITDGSEPQWWDDSADATLTDEDTSGEAITDKFERAFKCVTTADDKYGYQTLTFSDEELLDAGVTEVSFCAWVYCANSNKASIGIYGTNLGLQESSQATGGSWQLLTVEGVTLDASDTAIELRLIVDTGTAYFGRMSLVVGPKAVMLKPRGLRYVPIQSVQHQNGAGVSDVAYSDTDCTTNTDNLAVIIETRLGIQEANGTMGSYVLLSHDDAIGADSGVAIARTQVSALWNDAWACVMCNDAQVIRYSVAELDDDSDLDYSIDLGGYWMWE